MRPYERVRTPGDRRVIVMGVRVEEIPCYLNPAPPFGILFLALLSDKPSLEAVRLLTYKTKAFLLRRTRRRTQPPNETTLNVPVLFQ